MSSVKSRRSKTKTSEELADSLRSRHQSQNASQAESKPYTSRRHGLREESKERRTSKNKSPDNCKPETAKRRTYSRSSRMLERNSSTKPEEGHRERTYSDTRECIDDKEEISQSSRESESVRDQNSSLGCYDDTDDCRSTASRRSDCSNSGRSSLPTEDGPESESKMEDDSDSVCTTPRLSRSRKKSSDSLSRKRRRNISSQSEDSSLETQRHAAMQRVVQTRNGILFKIGERLEAMDFQDKWYAAKIIDVDNDVNEILIHFERWNSRYDEWVPMDSPRLRPTTHPYTRRDVQSAKKQKIVTEFKVGEAVLARWTDCKMYQANIKEILSDGYYTVIFYDGFQRRLHAMNIHKATEDSESKYEKMRPPDVNNFDGKQDNSCSSSGKPEFSVAPKEFVIEEDHNQFKCPEKDCGKGFRKEVLLLSHMKHYHSGSASVSPTPSATSRRQRKESENRSLDQSDTETSVSRVSVEADPSSFEIKSELPANAEEPLPTSIECLPAVISSETEMDVSSSSVLEVKKEEPDPVPQPLKIVQRTRLMKKIYPVTKMETRHAKLCFFKEDFSYLKEAKYLKSSGHRGEAIGSTQKGDFGKQAMTKKSSRLKDCDPEERKSTPKKSPLLKSVKTESRELQDVAVTDEIIVKEEMPEIQQFFKDATEKTDLANEANSPPDDEVVRCICECNDENGLMIQCEVCMTWQHGDCFDIDDVQLVPEKYICYMCVEPTGLRKSFRYKYDQDWLEKGQLARFAFLKKDPPSVGQSEAILATHNLTSSVHGILNVLHGLQQKLELLRSESNSELRYWSKPWTPSGATDHSVKKECENVQKESENANAPDSRTDSASKTFSTVFDHSYFSPKQESVVALLSGPQEVAAEAVVTTTSENKGDEDGVPNTVALDHGYAEEVAERLKEPEPDMETCSSNLTDHIRSVQNEMSSQLDAMEELLDFLEAEAGSEDSFQGAPDLDDFPDVMKSVRSLAQDLITVKKFTRHRS